MSNADTPAPSIWMQTLTGRAMDLMAPQPGMVDLFGDVAEALARIPRFTGHVAGGPYSVAQHCVLGMDAILAESGDVELARAFLLHDAHEAYCGDIATPVNEALRERVGRALASMMPSVGAQARRTGKGMARDAITGLKRDLDAAIHAAARMPAPLPPDIVAGVHVWDLRMLQVERAHLLAVSPFPWHPSVEAVPPARLRERIRIWPWPEAADTYRSRLLTFFPHLAAVRAA